MYGRNKICGVGILLMNRRLKDGIAGAGYDVPFCIGDLARGDAPAAMRQIMMTSNPKRTPLMGGDVCAIAVLFLPACFLYVWRGIQTHLIYTAFGDLLDFPLFSPDRAFLFQQLASPGGPVRYVANFLSQGFYYDVVGAIIITAVAFAFYLTTLILLQVVTNVRSHVLAAIPAITAVALCGDYNHHLPALLALLASVAFAAAFGAWCIRNSVAAVALFALMFGVLYWAAAAAGLLFAVLAGLVEVLRRRWFNALADIAVAAAAAYLMGTMLFGLEMPRPFSTGLPIFPLAATLRTPSLTYLYLCFPVGLLLVAVARKIMSAISRITDKPADHRRRHRKKDRRHKKPGGPLVPASLRIGLRISFAVLVIAAAAVGAVLATRNPDQKKVLLMDDLLQKRQWQAYLDAAETFRRRGFYNLHVNHDVNRALYHTGRLLDDMFAFNQKLDALMIITAEPMRFATRFLRVADLSFDLGNLNDAEHWSYELLDSEGPTPALLEKLIDINLAKDQPAAAGVFLNVLAKDLVHGPRARQRLRTLASDDALQSDPRIEQARAMRWRTDNVLNHQNAEQLLLDLLDEHPDNRMAFEYLMALYLLSHNQQQIVANLYRLDTVGCERIPRCLEEAILVYSDKTRRPVNLYGRQISPETTRRHKRYIEIFNQTGKNKQAAFGALDPEFGDSYFFYSMFNVSGARP
jgi:hypothetical protein